jgi:hypothetical protein
MESQERKECPEIMGQLEQLEQEEPLASQAHLEFPDWPVHLDSARKETEEKMDSLDFRASQADPANKGLLELLGNQGCPDMTFKGHRVQFLTIQINYILTEYTGQDGLPGVDGWWV